MSDNTEAIVTLQRLIRQSEMAIELLRTGPLVQDDNYRSTPNTFQVGDFIVQDRFWVSGANPSGTP